MNKYERKRIAKWEMQKAKRQEAFERALRKQNQEDDLAFLSDIAHTYQPDMSNSVTDMLSTHMPPPPPPPAMWHSYGWFWLIKTDNTKLQYTIDVPASVEAIKQWVYYNALMNIATGFYRTLNRTRLIKEELEFKVRKFRAILNCKIFKEELMMNVWHPRRVDHILNAYGWSAWENLLG